MTAAAFPATAPILSGLVVCLALAGCLRVGADPAYPGPAPLPEAVQARYASSSATFTPSSRLVEKSATYTLQRVTLPAVQLVLPVPHDIVLDYYRPTGEKPPPVILVLPILAGKAEIEGSFARCFAEKGLAAIVVRRHNRRDFITDLESVEPYFRQSVLDHRQVLDWVASRKELDASRIGVFGISLGAINAALLAALDPRVDASVLALAGGDLPYLLSHTSEKGLAEIRRDYLEEHGMTPEELEEELRRSVVTDPLHYARAIDARKTLLFLAVFDTIVPFAKGRELKAAIGHPETVYLPTGHYSSALFKGYVRRSTARFFIHQLLE